MNIVQLCSQGRFYGSIPLIGDFISGYGILVVERASFAGVFFLGAEPAYDMILS